MIFFAIRHLPTGHLMGSNKQIHGKAWTHWDPTIPTKTPRLFRNLQSAGQALTWWLAGKAYTAYSDHYEYGREVHGVDSEKVEGRNRDDMEIVEVRLQVHAIPSKEV